MATAKDQLKLIRLLHFALMGGAGLFAVMAAILIVSDEVSQPSIEVLDYLSPAYFFIMLATYPAVFKAALKKTALLEKTLSQKLASFQTAHIIRMAMLEGCALFASVAALINGELLHLIIASLTLAIMFSKTPTPFLLESELGLDQDEKDQLIVL